MERNESPVRRFGRRLRFMRERQQLTIEELAARSDIDPRQLARIEAGDVNILFTTILALARGLDISPEELLDSV